MNDAAKIGVLLLMAGVLVACAEMFEMPEGGGWGEPATRSQSKHQHQEQLVADGGGGSGESGKLMGSSAAPSWTGYKLEAEGQSVVNTAGSANEAQAKLVAKRAATLDARRNLLEKVLALNIDSNTTVRGVVPEKDRADASASGVLTSAALVGAPEYTADGICKVKVEVKLSEVWRYVQSVR